MSAPGAPATVREDSFDARSALAGAAGLAAAGLALVGLQFVTGDGIACPFRALTGLLCPFCGSTTMAQSLLRGDVASAWSHNPLLLIGAALLAAASLAWAIEILGGPKVRPPARWRPFTQRRGYLVGGLILAVFGVARNLM